MARSKTQHPTIYRRVAGETHGRHRPVACVLHCTESNNIRNSVRDVLAIPNFWRLQGKGYNAHCVGDAEGNVVKCALDNRICWAVGNHNTGRLHFEMIGFTTYSEQDWMNAGLREAAAWFAYWSVTHGIPARTSVTAGMATHAMYAKAFPNDTDHTDPGANFPWDHFMYDVRVFVRDGWPV